MNPSEPRAPDDSTIEALLAHVPWPQGDGPLDDETLAAWAEGGLSELERDAVEARLAEWPDARDWVTQVKAAQPAEAPAETQSTEAPPTEAPPTETSPAEEGPAPSFARQTMWMPIAAAALMLAAIGVMFFAGGFDQPGEPTLAETVAKLRADHAELFGDFELLDDQFLSQRGEATRGGLVTLRPRHTIAPLKPDFAWAQREGIERYDVTLYDAEGRVVWTRQTSDPMLSYPEGERALTRGASYVWEVSGDDGLGAQTATRKFEVLSLEDWNRYGDVLGDVLNATKDLPTEQQAIVRAHFAIRLGLIEDASVFLRADRPDPDNADSRHPLIQKTEAFLQGQ